MSRTARALIIPPLAAASFGITTAILWGTASAMTGPSTPPPATAPASAHTPAEKPPAHRAPRPTVRPGHPVIIYGCKTESDCSAVYNGDGTWAIIWDPNGDGVADR
jgi:hypothetical protein